MPKLLKIILKILISLILLITALICLFVWGTGIWENRPVLDHISGPMRFKQYVAKPIPADVYDLKGGYSGFPAGVILTRFKFRGNVDNLGFLKDWGLLTEPIPMPDTLNKTSRRFVKEGAYLLFNPETKEGFLYIP